MNFYFARSGELNSRNELRLPNDARLQRLKEAVDLDRGKCFRVCVEGVGRGSARLKDLTDTCALAEVEFEESFTLSPVSVILAIPRPKALKRVVPDLVALGVDSITLVNACGVKREYFDTHWLQAHNMRELVELGLEQSGLFRVPEVRVKRRLKPFLQDELMPLKSGEGRLLCRPADRKVIPDLHDVSECTLAVGPETGWTGFEEDLFVDAGFKELSLGPGHLATRAAASALVGAVRALMPL